MTTRHRAAQGRRGTERLCALTGDGEAGRRHDPVRGLAGRRGVPDLKRRLPGTRRLDHGDARRRSTTRSRARCLRAASSAMSRAGPTRWTRPSGCWNAPRSTRSPSPTRPAGSRSGSPRSKPRWPAGRWRRSCMRRTASPDGVRKLAAALRRRQTARSGQNPGHCGVYVGAIGFGIGAVKCGTCCAACRPRKQRVPCALPAPRTLPDHRPDGRGTGSARLNSDCNECASRNGSEWRLIKTLARRR